jgi:hypothetical protein
MAAAPERTEGVDEGLRQTPAPPPGNHQRLALERACGPTAKTLLGALIGGALVVHTTVR